MLGMMIIVAFWAAECLAFPIFIRAQWPQKCVKSFVWKVISATIFVGYGVYLMLGYSLVDIKFSKYMVIGLALGWLGDVLLHLTALSKKPSKVFEGASFVAGLVAFLVGHIFYVLAYINALQQIDKWNSGTIRTIIIIVAVMLVGFVTAQLIVKLKLGIAVIPVLLYAITISTMLACAVMLAINTFSSMPEFAFVIALGAVLFVISDGTLVFCIFGSEKAKNSYSLKVVNLTTYFIGQMLLASTISLYSYILQAY